jgi:hypothetical protein
VTNPGGASATFYPLEGVFVTCDQNTSLTPEQLLTAQSIVWTFADADGQFDTVEGFNAAHSFVDAGPASITLTITLADGEVSTATTDLNIATDNRPTVEIAAGEAVPTFQSNTRYLFQDGGTWDFDSTQGTIFDASGLSHVYVGSYGSGAQPIIYSDNTPEGGSETAIGSDPNTVGLVVDGLTFDSNVISNNVNMSNYAVISPSGNGGITLIGCTSLNIGEFVYGQSQMSNVAAIDCSSPVADDLAQYFMYSQGNGSELVLLGDSINGSQGQALVRFCDASSATSYGGDVCIFGCTFNKSTDTDGKASITFQDGVFMSAIDNTFIGCAPGSNNTDPGEFVKMGGNEICQYIVVASNTSSQQMVATLDAQPVSAQHVMIDNNAINVGAYAGVELWSTGTSGLAQASDIYVMNNTISSTDPQAEALVVGYPSPVQITYTGNAFVDPNLSNSTWFISVMGAPSSSYAGAANLLGFTEIANNLWPTIQPGNSGYAFLVGGQNAYSSYFTAATWEQQALGSGGTPTDDVYANPTVDSSYTVSNNGNSYGSSLPVS